MCTALRETQNSLLTPRQSEEASTTAVWEERISGILNASSIFFNSAGIMEEQACESEGTCDTDQFSFKAYFAVWLAQTAILAPFAFDAIAALIKPTAEAAAQQCDGGASGTQCGFRWTMLADNDGSWGVGQQMSALAAIQSAMVLVPEVYISGPVTNSTGGTSIGDPTAGTSPAAQDSIMAVTPATTADKVFAILVTLAAVGAVLVGTVVMVLDG